MNTQLVKSLQAGNMSFFYKCCSLILFHSSAYRIMYINKHFRLFCKKPAAFINFLVLRSFKFRYYKDMEFSLPKKSGGFRLIKAAPLFARMQGKIFSNLLQLLFTSINTNPFQHGYIPGRSIFSAILSLNKAILTNKEKQILEYDFTGFFDNIEQRYLVSVFTNLSMPIKLLDILPIFFNRGKGIKQGSALSPTLSNFAVLCSGIFDPTKTISYSDDGVILTNDSRLELECLVQRLEKSSTGIKVNINKCISNDGSKPIKFLGFELRGSNWFRNGIFISSMYDLNQDKLTRSLLTPTTGINRKRNYTKQHKESRLAEVLCLLKRS